MPSEDAVILERPADPREGRKLIACPILPRISDFDDLDPPKLEPGVALVLVPPGRPIPAEAAIIILPGSKATIADLAALRAEGWDIDIKAHHRRGGLVVGLCGGYQMLGRSVADLLGIEGAPGEVEGLGLLDVATTLSPAKTLCRVRGEALGAAIEGYEMPVSYTHLDVYKRQRSIRRESRALRSKASPKAFATASPRRCSGCSSSGFPACGRIRRSTPPTA